MGGSDLLTLSTAAAASNTRNPGGRPYGGGENPAARHPRILDVKSQRIAHVARETEIVKGLAERLLDWGETRGKSGKSVAAGYNSTRGLGLGLVGLGLGLAGIKLAAGGLHSEGVVDITATPVPGILGAKRLLGSAVLDEIIAARLRQHNTDIGIRSPLFVRVGVTYGTVL